MKITTLNLNGIRSATKKGVLDWLARSRADIVCLQELKAQTADMSTDMLNPPGYYGYFHYAEKKGYSGVGIWSRKQPDAIVEGLSIPDIDCEGRYIEARFGNLSVVSFYIPSGSSGDVRLKTASSQRDGSVSQDFQERISLKLSSPIRRVSRSSG